MTGTRCGWLPSPKDGYGYGDAAWGWKNVGEGGYSVFACGWTGGVSSRDLHCRLFGAFGDGVPEPGDHLEGKKCNLARLQGNTFRGHGWTKEELTRCAKVGYYLSCTSATLVAVPATYATGEFPNMKARSL